MRLKKEKELEETFFNELVTFISRHFIDDRIANPDLKENLATNGSSNILKLSLQRIADTSNI
jgi:hypothetical protein